MALIARRSRHYAGTRYLKRGVNEKGRVANDVETEQIVFEDVAEGFPVQITSVVQNRGSIPLFWSQETSRLNLKPDIILSKKDQTYEATRLHFENLAKRYGNPIIILNLIKTHEKRPRESILRTEFANAIESINKNLSEEHRLRFLHWDLNKHSRGKAINVLFFLGKAATYALTLTGFFYCQATPPLRSEAGPRWPCLESSDASCMDRLRHHNADNVKRGDGENSDSDHSEGKANGNPSIKPPMLQNGVLRTNCIDCLDRTNVAQYAYGLAALGHQLCALGVTSSTKIDLDDPLAEDLMGFYERMGDTLAHQYGGSAAHNKIFSARRGQWRAATQSQEFFRTLQRYYNNAYMDAEKQNAINIFLGHFQPQEGKPDIWVLDSDQHYNVSRNGDSNVDENGRSFFKRSFSDGNILHESQSPIPTRTFGKDFSNADFSDQSQGSKVPSESTPEISTCESDMTYSRYTGSMPARELFVELQRDKCVEHENGDASDCSNFVDLDWLSSSGNSCEEELLERMYTISPIAGMSSENVVNEMTGEITPSISEGESSTKGKRYAGVELPYKDAHIYEVLEEFSDSFVCWVNYGETLCH